MDVVALLCHRLLKIRMIIQCNSSTLGMAKQENADHAGYLYNSEVLHLRWDLIKLPPGIHCLLTRLFSM